MHIEQCPVSNAGSQSNTQSIPEQHPAHAQISTALWLSIWCHLKWNKPWSNSGQVWIFSRPCHHAIISVTLPHLALGVLSSLSNNQIMVCYWNLGWKQDTRACCYLRFNLLLIWISKSLSMGLLSSLSKCATRNVLSEDESIYFYNFCSWVSLLGFLLV